MGIELKTKHGKSLQTLFSRIPSRYEHPNGKLGFFEEHAYNDSKRGRKALYTSFNSNMDSLGFQLQVRGHTVEIRRHGLKVLEYDAEELEAALLSKHSQTAFIAVQPASATKEDAVAIESVKMCKWPSVLRFLKLIESGAIYLDFTLAERSGKVKDHGFLWRIKSDSIEDLYLSAKQFRV